MSRYSEFLEALVFLSEKRITSKYSQLSIVKINSFWLLFFQLFLFHGWLGISLSWVFSVPQWDISQDVHLFIWRHSFPIDKPVSAVNKLLAIKANKRVAVHKVIVLAYMMISQYLLLIWFIQESSWIMFYPSTNDGWQVYLMLSDIHIMRRRSRLVWTITSE